MKSYYAVQKICLVLDFICCAYSVNLSLADPRIGKFQTFTYRIIVISANFGTVVQ